MTEATYRAVRNQSTDNSTGCSWEYYTIEQRKRFLWIEWWGTLCKAEMGYHFPREYDSLEEVTKEVDFLNRRIPRYTTDSHPVPSPAKGQTMTKFERDNTLKLGDKGQDQISGFTGTVVAITEWLNGCRRITIQPNTLHEGKPMDSSTFDAEQIAKVEEGPALSPTRSGGPAISPVRSADPR